MRASLEGVHVAQDGWPKGGCLKTDELSPARMCACACTLARAHACELAAGSFEEALQKACRMVSDSYRGFEPEQFPGPASRELIEMVHPTPNRLFAIANVLFHRRMSVDDVHGVTKIDKWFLDRLQSIVDTSDALHEAKAHVRGVSASGATATSDP
jgi:hypothetical protein